MSMGHLLGLFDGDWLGIRRTRKMALLRYADSTTSGRAGSLGRDSSATSSE